MGRVRKRRLLGLGLGLALLLTPLAGCRPRVDASGVADPAATVCDGEARTSLAKPPPVAPSPSSDPAPSLGGDPEREAVTHFGIFTPVFPGVGANALETRCDPNDFYGGCL